MVNFYYLMDKQRYFRIRYELDQILPDATIQVTKGRFIESPYERVTFSVDFSFYRTEDPPYGFNEL